MGKRPLRNSWWLERLMHLLGLPIISKKVDKNSYWIPDTWLVVISVNNSNWEKWKSVLNKTIDSRLALVSKEAGTFHLIKEQRPLKQKAQKMKYEKLQTEQLNKLYYWFSSSFYYHFGQFIWYSETLFLLIL